MGKREGEGERVDKKAKALPVKDKCAVRLCGEGRSITVLG